MNKFKYILSFILFAIGFCLLAGMAQAADHSVMVGIPMLFGAEYEGTATDRLTFCLDVGACPAAGIDFNSFSIGGKLYFSGEPMDGPYVGAQVGNLNGSGKFLGLFDIGSDDDTYAQFRLGFKKVTDSGFSYDLGIYGIALGENDMAAGMTLLFGYSW